MTSFGSLVVLLWHLPATAFVDFNSTGVVDAAPTKIRPGAGGPADKVKFGLWMKAFLGSNVIDSSFSADMVLTLRWTDHRAAAFVPPGSKTVHLSGPDAAKQIWTPAITISNRDIGGLEVISSAATIGTGGEVETVERLLTTVKNDFDTRYFPFDTHNFSIHLASSALMTDSLVLSPIEQVPDWIQADADEPQLSGVEPQSFAGSDFSLVNSRVGVFREVDGALIKSRGELVIRAKRNTEAYVENIFFPAFLLLGMSWTIFFFPNLPSFTMPRVSVSALSFLALVTLSRRIDDAMPTRSALCWIDVFVECTESLMFGAICLNITEVYIYNTLNGHKLGCRLGHELMFLYPFLTFVTMGICFSATDGCQLERTRLLTRLCTGVGVGTYIASAFGRHMQQSHPERLGSTLGPALQPPGSGSLRSSGNIESLGKATMLCANLAAPKTWDGVTFLPAGIPRSGPG